MTAAKAEVTVYLCEKMKWVQMRELSVGVLPFA